MSFTQRGKALKIAKAVSLCKVGAVYERVVVKVPVRDRLPLSILKSLSNNHKMTCKMRCYL